MKRVIIVPVSEILRFPNMTVIARGGPIAALLGDSFEGRSRDAFGSDEEFFDAVATGRADLNTFTWETDAATFACAKIEALNAQAHRIEEAMNRIASFPRKAPQTDAPEVIPIEKLRA
jgi:hypothetical protein